MGGTHNKDYSILGSILGSPYLGKVPRQAPSTPNNQFPQRQPRTHHPEYSPCETLYDREHIKSQAGGEGVFQISMEGVNYQDVRPYDAKYKSYGRDYVFRTTMCNC